MEGIEMNTLFSLLVEWLPLIFLVVGSLLFLYYLYHVFIELFKKLRKQKVKMEISKELEILKGLEIVNLYLASSTSFIAFYTFALAIKLKYFILAFIGLVTGVILFVYFCINLKEVTSRKGNKK
jgi:hypothetical protein